MFDGHEGNGDLEVWDGVARQADGLRFDWILEDFDAVAFWEGLAAHGQEVELLKRTESGDVGESVVVHF